MKRSGKWSYLLATLLVIVIAILVNCATEFLRHTTDGWRYASSSLVPPLAHSPLDPPEAELGEDMWVLASPLNKYVSIDSQWELLSAVQIALAFVIPAVFFVLARRWIGTGPALLLVVCSVWIARHAFRMAIGLPICLAYADTHGNSEYDGVGGNVVSLVFGWVEPLFTCLLIIAIGAVWRRLRRSSSQNLSAASEGS